MSVGENIRKLRKEKGMTQKALGTLCGINEANIRKYESGKQNPKLQTIEKIATALETTPFNLMGVSEDLDIKYPDLAKHAKEYECLCEYLNSIGYVIDTITEDTPISIEYFQRDNKMDLLSEEDIKRGYAMGVTETIKIIQNNKTYFLEEEEFNKLAQLIKDVIAFKLWVIDKKRLKKGVESQKK